MDQKIHEQISDPDFSSTIRFFFYSLYEDGMMVQWFALSPHSEKVMGLIVSNL